MGTDNEHPNKIQLRVLANRSSEPCSSWLRGGRTQTIVGQTNPKALPRRRGCRALSWKLVWQLMPKSSGGLTPHARNTGMMSQGVV
jgi:hypothetical protein